jgi:hypothetical protein
MVKMAIARSEMVAADVFMQILQLLFDSFDYCAMRVGGPRVITQPPQPRKK